MMATVIPHSRVASLGPVLDDFDPAKVIQRFTPADDLPDTII